MRPQIDEAAYTAGKKLIDGIQSGMPQRSQLNGVLVGIAAVLAVCLLAAGVRLYRTWHAAAAVELLVHEIARRRDSREIQELARAVRRAGSEAGPGRYLSRFIRENDAGRNVFREFPGEAVLELKVG